MCESFGVWDFFGGVGGGGGASLFLKLSSCLLHTFTLSHFRRAGNQ